MQPDLTLIHRRLARLEAEYVCRVNAALSRGRDDIAAALAADYAEERKELLRAA
jgi:hypothetical protein